MKGFIKVFLVVLSGFVCIQNVSPQKDIPLNENLLTFYDNELFKWEYNAFGGFNLSYNHQKSSITFGINNDMVEALQQYPDTARYYNSYRKKTIAGNILLWGGYTLVLGGAVAPAFYYRDVNEETFDRNVKISLGVILGGLVVELIGAFILPSGYESLFNGINMYNRHKIGEYGQAR
ncbi:MAG: hypothetical protein LBD29_01910 [Treponema sp.]|nr:hypothetical protein [Treponema sp.]